MSGRAGLGLAVPVVVAVPMVVAIPVAVHVAVPVPLCWLLVFVAWEVQPGVICNAGLRSVEVVCALVTQRGVLCVFLYL